MHSRMSHGASGGPREHAEPMQVRTEIRTRGTGPRRSEPVTSAPPLTRPRIFDVNPNRSESVVRVVASRA